MSAPNPFAEYNPNDVETNKKISAFYDNEHYCKIEGTIEITKVTG